jgi:hypothetical protein
MSTDGTKFLPPGSARPGRHPRRSEPPSAAPSPADAPQQTLEEPKTEDGRPGQPSAPIASRAFRTITIEIPLAEPIDTETQRHRSRHADVHIRQPERRRAFNALRSGLDAAGAMIKPDNPSNPSRRVVSYADAVQYVLDQIAAQYAKQMPAEE